MSFKTMYKLLPWLSIAVLMAALTAGLLTATPSPQDDHFLYRQFIESLAAGMLDLSIPGFHGTDIFGFIVYLMTGSPIAQIYGLMIPAIGLPLMGFLAGRALFKDTWSGVLLATAIAMMPFISFVLLRGWTGPGYWFWMLMTVWLAARGSRWTGIPWALAILTKPFAVILLPLIIVLNNTTGKKTHRSPLTTHRFVWPILSSFMIVALYLVTQYLQSGRIFVGTHTDLAVGSFIQSGERILLNLAHSLQILFSVHNYYYPNPALTGPGNMMHTTPVLVFLGLFGMLAPKAYWKNVRIPVSLLVGALLGIAMNALLDHMDHFYMEASILLFVIGAIPVMKKHPFWIPIALATLHFQWFYFWLQYQPGFALTSWFWGIPVVVDLLWFCWFAVHRRWSNG